MKTKQFLIASLISTGLIFAACLSENELNAQNSTSQTKVNTMQYDQSNGDVASLSNVNGPVHMTNYPDPFYNVTYIKYAISFPSHIRLTVYESSTGRKTLLYEGPQVTGTHYIAFRPESELNLEGKFIAELITQQASVKEVMIKLVPIDDVAPDGTSPK